LLSTREYPNVINIFFVLASLGIEVKGRGIRHVTARFIGNHCDVITYLGLNGITFRRIKRIAYRHVRRPGHAGVGAKGIEQL
jgi:hypothetical protein